MSFMKFNHPIYLLLSGDFFSSSFSSTIDSFLALFVEAVVAVLDPENFFSISEISF